MTATAETLFALDEALAAKGHPRFFAPGSWWRDEATRFYESPAALEWWAQVGRGGIKTGVMLRTAENETLFGGWSTGGPGERHLAIVASRSKEEASKGLGIVAHEFDDLGVRYRIDGDCLELLDAPRGIRIVAANVGATSGWRAYFIGCDELAKWPIDGAMAVDARETIASMRAMTVTHRGARRLFFSSPFATSGPHFERVAAGDNETTVVSIAPSWVANPIVTEVDTRALEPHEPTWRREYAAIPSAGGAGAFDSDDVGARR